MKLITTIIPVHNGAPYLREALDSVVSQDYANQQVIVVDDGSTDESADIAGTYPSIEVIRKSHEGVAAARNTAIETAMGELFAFIDADDHWEPGKLTLQADYLAKHPEMYGVFGLLRNYVQTGIDRPSWLKDHQVGRDVPGYSLCTLLVRREAFEEIGLMRASKQARTATGSFARRTPVSSLEWLNNDY